MKIEKRIYINTFKKGDLFKKPSEEIIINSRDLSRVNLPVGVEVFEFFERKEICINNEIYRTEKINISKKHIIAEKLYDFNDKNLNNETYQLMKKNGIDILAITKSNSIFEINDNFIVLDLKKNVIYPK